MPTALPDATLVPINAIFFLSASNVSLGRDAVDFSIVKDSPVNADSSILHWYDSKILMSAGTFNPSYRLTTSPGTNSEVAISISVSFLTTTHCETDIFLSDSIACSACPSCQYPKYALAVNTMKIKIASPGSSG